MSLVPCPACARHVRALDAHGSPCPFCGALVLSRPPAPSVPRVGRAAILAFGATVGACCGTTAPAEPDRTERSRGGEVASGDHDDPTDGGRGGARPTDPGPDDGGGVVALYGAPAPN